MSDAGDKQRDERVPEPLWVDEFRSEQLPPEGLGAQAGGYRRIIANPGFRRLWIGQVISGIGDWLVIGLLIPLVTQLSNGSSLAVAGIMIAKIIPSLLFGSVLGVARRPVRPPQAHDRVRPHADGALPRPAVHEQPRGSIYLIVLLMETMGLMFYPAKNALIPQLVEPRDLAVANGLSYTTQQASMLDRPHDVRRHRRRVRGGRAVRARGEAADRRHARRPVAAPYLARPARGRAPRQRHVPGLGVHDLGHRGRARPAATARRWTCR